MNKKPIFWLLIVHISRILVGIVFIFSGFVKGIDPLGSIYKFQDYFTAFHLDFLNLLAFPLALILIYSEFLIGISLVFNIKTRYGIWGALIYMILFTPLTLVLALTNPVSDCGCFGDALVLSNWETFIKNIIIISFTILAFRERQIIKTPWSLMNQWLGIGISGLFIFGISLYGLRHLPLIDFRPYKTGTSISDDRSIPEGAPVDEYETTLIYEKEGKQVEFSMDDFPWDDSSWVFIDQKSVLINKGFEPPIHDFNIISADGQDLTDDVLIDPSYTLIFFSTHFDKADPRGLSGANDLALFSAQNNINSIYVTSTSIEQAERLAFDQGLTFTFSNMDETTLKTVIRANPGLVVLKEGIILGKYHWRDFPGPEELSKNLLSEELKLTSNQLTFWRIFGISVVFVLLVIIGIKIKFKKIINS